ncbi:hypothetical protein LT493_14665 [Streptomyces tricolor]|nr:hypothetical protein [Streptomyces tricolor]
MSVRARLRAVVPALLPSAEADLPELLGLPGRRLLAQRADDALVVQPLDEAFAPAGDRVRVPAPWPRRRGTWAVAPDVSLAVFAGVHAVRAVEPSGATLLGGPARLLVRRLPGSRTDRTRSTATVPTTGIRTAVRSGSRWTGRSSGRMCAGRWRWASWVRTWSTSGCCWTRRTGGCSRGRTPGPRRRAASTCRTRRIRRRWG